MKIKNAPATESGDPVGSQLSVARLRLGWTLEEASSRTRLHHNILRQLEAGQFDKLPSLAYTRGFLRIYSRELGLDPKILLREFQPSADREDSILDLRPEMLEALPTRASEPIFTSRGLGLGVLSIAGLFILAVATSKSTASGPSNPPKIPPPSPRSVPPKKITPPHRPHPQPHQTASSNPLSPPPPPNPHPPPCPPSKPPPPPHLNPPNPPHPNSFASAPKKIPGSVSSPFAMAKKFNFLKIPSTKTTRFPTRTTLLGAETPSSSPPAKPPMPKSFSTNRTLAPTKNQAPRPSPSPPADPPPTSPSPRDH